MILITNSQHIIRFPRTLTHKRDRILGLILAANTLFDAYLSSGWSIPYHSPKTHTLANSLLAWCYIISTLIGNVENSNHIHRKKMTAMECYYSGLICKVSLSIYSVPETQRSMNTNPSLTSQEDKWPLLLPHLSFSLSKSFPFTMTSLWGFTHSLLFCTFVYLLIN